MYDFVVSLQNIPVVCCAFQKHNNAIKPLIARQMRFRIGF